jgi:hypothetical protein
LCQKNIVLRLHLLSSYSDNLSTLSKHIVSLYQVSLTIPAFSLVFSAFLLAKLLMESRIIFLLRIVLGLSHYSFIDSFMCSLLSFQFMHVICSNMKNCFCQKPDALFCQLLAPADAELASFQDKNHEDDLRWHFASFANTDAQLIK